MLLELASHDSFARLSSKGGLVPKSPLKHNSSSVVEKILLALIALVFSGRLQRIRL